MLRAQPESKVSLAWTELGGGFGYIIETRDSWSNGVGWSLAPASIWPQPWAAWADPRGGTSRTAFYRVAATPAAAVRGAVLSATDVQTLTPAEIQAGFALIGNLVSAKSGVVLTKLIYETINPFGLRTIASGLVVRPEGLSHPLPLASYQHGTVTVRTQVPSAEPGLDRLIGIALGTSGYVTAIPDYLGLGDSPGLHPFVHARSQATAAIDLLRAVRTFCASQGVTLNGQLFLTGYSEGGHAAMATHREIETSYASEFTVTASAPMAGPYDLSGVMADDFLSGRPMDNPYYFLYLLAAYQSIYRFAERLSDLLVSPYDRTLPPLLDGTHGSGEMNRAIGTAQPLGILQPAFLDAFAADPKHPLRLALLENDVYDWIPKAPMRLYHCAGDQEVLFANSQSAYAAFQRNGATHVKLVDLSPSADHTGCAPFSLLDAKIWFDSMVTPAGP